METIEWHLFATTLGNVLGKNSCLYVLGKGYLKFGNIFHPNWTTCLSVPVAAFLEIDNALLGLYRKLGTASAVSQKLIPHKTQVTQHTGKEGEYESSNFQVGDMPSRPGGCVIGRKQKVLPTSSLTQKKEPYGQPSGAGSNSLNWEGDEIKRIGLESWRSHVRRGLYLSASTEKPPLTVLPQDIPVKMWR